MRDAMVELIKIVEGFYACGVAASVYATEGPRRRVMPDPVFANVGKLLLATQIYDMHRLAHYVSGGLIVTLPGPTRTTTRRPRPRWRRCSRGRPDIPYDKRIEVARASSRT